MLSCVSGKVCVQKNTTCDMIIDMMRCDVPMRFAVGVDNCDFVI